MDIVKILNDTIVEVTIGDVYEIVESKHEDRHDRLGRLSKVVDITDKPKEGCSNSYCNNTHKNKCIRFQEIDIEGEEERFNVRFWSCYYKLRRK